MKTHLKITGVDCRDGGQTQFEYEHQTICGYVREKVSKKLNDVDCKLCKRELFKQQEDHFNQQVY